MKRILAIACLLASLAASAATPIVGQKFPDNLNASDATGKIRGLQSLMGKKGLALFFVRSADWCPFCKGQLVDANRHLAAFRALGIEVASVSVDEVPPIAEFAKSQGIGYTMLSDPKGAINERLGIRDTQYPVGSSAFGVPRPTLYILDSTGRIRLQFQEPTFRTRPNLDAVIQDIRKLSL
jgi:peroxiredoxin